jgi:signal transduction histidine kinase
MNDESNFQVLKDKIDQLNRQAWENRVNDSTKAHLLSREAFELAESINYITGMAEGYRTFAFTLIRLSRHQEALEYAEKSMALFQSLNDKDGQTKIYEYYGIIQRSYGNYSASISFLFKALEHSQQTGNKESESLACYHLGVTHKYLGDTEKALNYLLQSLAITRLNHFWIECYSLNMIGVIYFETGDLTKALDYYHQSLSARQQAGDKWGEAGCLDNIGIIHFKLKDNSRALEFCSRALAISQQVDDKKGEANSLFHLGNILEEITEYRQASTYYNNSLIIRRNIGDKKGETESLLSLAALYLKDNTGDQSGPKVFELLQEALQLGEETKANDLLSKIHFGFYEACKLFKLYPEALEHIETYISISKKIDSDAVNEKIKNLEISLKAAETDKKLVKALQENQKIVEMERTRLAKDLHDGLGGMLSGIKLTLGSIPGNMVLTGDNTIVLAKAIGQLDNTIAEMRRVAHSMMPEALLRFGLSEAIQDFCDGINESNLVKMKFTQIGLNDTIEKPTEVILYRIVQELSNNAIKHAAADTIFIQLNKHEQGLTLTFEDDGKGFDITQIKKGDGLQNIQSRVDYLKGNMEIHSKTGEGSSFNIEIPK